MDFDSLMEHLKEKIDLEKEREKGPFEPLFGDDDFGEISAGKVFATIVNPIYAGVPPYPPIIDEDKWIETQCKMVERYGAKLVFRAQLDALRAIYKDS